MKNKNVDDLFNNKKGDKVGDDIAGKIMDDFDLLESVVEAFEEEKDHVKKAAAKAVRKVSEHAPEKVYSYFEKVEKLLDSPDEEVKTDAIVTIANMSGVDEEGKISESLWQRIADYIADRSVETASAAVEALGKIGEHIKPYREQIVAKLIELERLGKDSVEKNEKLNKALEVIENLSPKLDKESLEKLEDDIKEGFDDAVDATKRKAEEFFSKFKKK